MAVDTGDKPKILVVKIWGMEPAILIQDNEGKKGVKKTKKITN